MPQVILSQRALEDIRRLKEFLSPKDADAAQRAAKTIIQAVNRLEQFPAMGRSAEWLGSNIRELPIKFGRAGYLAAYVFQNNHVVIVAVRHMREAGYENVEQSEHF
jgi:plasmid stabilization system protein ParE